MAAGQESARGSVGIEVFREKLRLRLPRELYNGKQKYIYTRLPDSQEGWEKANIKAWAIEDDIQAGIFDPTLEKYKPQLHLSILKPQEAPKEVLTLIELWDRYTEYRRPQIAETTLKLNYQKTASHIKKLPFKELSDAIPIRDHLLLHNSAYTAKRVIIQLNACCNWACESSLLAANPFKGMAEKIKVVQDEEDIDPFSPAERDAIIQGFEQHPTYYYYVPFVRFLFMTGCRTSEAVGLQWKHISSNCSQITFSEAVVCVSSHKIRKNTKTGRPRKFPCNTQLRELLLSIKPEDCQPQDLVFPSLTGKEINSHTFSALCWKGTKIHGKYQEGIVTRLVTEGKVERYRPQYNTRHTFITMALEANVSVPQVAKWVGNSSEIILKHYAGTLRQVQVPEF